MVIHFSPCAKVLLWGWVNAQIWLRFLKPGHKPWLEALLPRRWSSFFAQRQWPLAKQTPRGRSLCLITPEAGRGRHFLTHPSDTVSFPNISAMRRYFFFFFWFAQKFATIYFQASFLPNDHSAWNLAFTLHLWGNKNPFVFQFFQKAWHSNKNYIY